MRAFAISDKPLDIADLVLQLRDDSVGAFVSFEGWVRDHNEGQQVQSLSYEVFHTLAEAEGERIILEAVEQYGLTAAACVHREGKLGIGECAVWVGVTAPHRGKAFAAASHIIDAIKHRLPIWKKEFYADGKTAWVNCQHCASHAGHKPAANKTAPVPAAADYYSRQLRLPEIGAAGQAKLAAARVLVVGLGGLGSAAALGLASAGVGMLGLVEQDRLEASNLHRQMIYDAADIGQLKGRAAAQRLRAHNPLIKILEHDMRLTAANAEALLADYDLVLDCTDNFSTKYLLNDATVLLDKTLIQASLYRFEGQLLTIEKSGQGGCLRCLWPAPPAAGAIGDCAETGVLGTVPALFGTLQANEAIKHILGLSTPSRDSLLLFDLLTLSSQTLSRQRRVECPVCGVAPSITQLLPLARQPFELAAEASEDLPSLARRFTLIDLREIDEGPVLPDTLRLPFRNFTAAAIDHLRDKPVLLICTRGSRSLQIAATLFAAGWRQAFSLQNGISGLATSPRQQAA